MNKDENTLEELYLDRGDGHKLYVQAWGQKSSSHVFLYLHGGPGSGCSDSAKKFFNPLTDRVIFFDQRGCGKSKAEDLLTHNTTQDLINDIGAILDYFKLKDVVIFGGSWGSCLGLMFALEHPIKVRSMVLRGIFTGTKAELDYFCESTIKPFFPQEWAEFIAHIPLINRHNPVEYIGKVLKEQPGSQEFKTLAYAYAKLEAKISQLNNNDEFQDIDAFNANPMAIHFHYLINHCFIPENYILSHARALTMPVEIIQGRYDLVCIPEIAYLLHKNISSSSLTWTTAGHSWKDPETFKVLREKVAEISS